MTEPNDPRPRTRQLAAFTKRDVQRAIKAAKQAGLQIGRLSFRRDGFDLIPGKPSDMATSPRVNEWDDEP